jgi:hypothetical protein
MWPMPVSVRPGGGRFMQPNLTHNRRAQQL